MPINRRVKIFSADQDDKCFACGKRLGKKPALVNVAHEDQNVYVGSECFKLIKAAGKKGWKPATYQGKPYNGPRLYLIKD